MTNENFTVKEMLKMLMNEMSEVKAATIKHAEHAESVDKHLLALNSKVAKHEEKIGSLKTQSTENKTKLGIGAAIISGIVAVLTSLTLK
jgi:hypothetical protein